MKWGQVWQDWYNQIASGKKTKAQLRAEFPSYYDRYEEWERVQNYNKQQEANQKAADQQAAQQAEQKKQAEVATKAKMAADQDRASLALKRKKGGPSAKGIFTSPLGLAANANLVRQTLGGM